VAAPLRAVEAPESQEESAEPILSERTLDLFFSSFSLTCKLMDSIHSTWLSWLLQLHSEFELPLCTVALVLSFAVINDTYSIHST
jgi:hypothetical protein